MPLEIFVLRNVLVVFQQKKNEKDINTKVSIFQKKHHVGGRPFKKGYDSNRYIFSNEYRIKGNISNQKRCALLRKTKSFELLEGIQQPPSPHEIARGHNTDSLEFEVEEIAKQIAETLTGKKVTFTERKK